MIKQMKQQMIEYSASNQQLSTSVIELTNRVMTLEDANKQLSKELADLKTGTPRIEYDADETTSDEEEGEKDSWLNVVKETVTKTNQKNIFEGCSEV